MKMMAHRFCLNFQEGIPLPVTIEACDRCGPEVVMGPLEAGCVFTGEVRGCPGCCPQFKTEKGIKVDGVWSDELIGMIKGNRARHLVEWIRKGKKGRKRAKSGGSIDGNVRSLADRGTKVHVGSTPTPHATEKGEWF